ncbi:MAG: type II secretion system protein [Candidatus Hydrogenedentes bacterium]|nr:type II secretion system protein [Candidatus Hydrogenedentota bacterium]
MQPLNEKNGFTLLEAVVVLMIAMIMTAAVLPMYQGSLTWARRDKVTRDLVARMKYAQERAIADVTEYRFYLDHERGTHWLMRHGGKKDGKDAYSEVDDAGATRERLPESLEFEKPKASFDKELKAHYIAFYPGGACDYATVKLKYDKHEAITIKTKGRIGQFEVETD